MRGEVGRYGSAFRIWGLEMRGEVGRCGSAFRIWASRCGGMGGEMGRYGRCGEMWGDVGAGFRICARRYSSGDGAAARANPPTKLTALRLAMR